MSRGVKSNMPKVIGLRRKMREMPLSHSFAIPMMGSLPVTSPPIERMTRATTAERSRTRTSMMAKRVSWSSALPIAVAPCKAGTVCNAVKLIVPLAIAMSNVAAKRVPAVAGAENFAGGIDSGQQTVSRHSMTPLRVFLP